MGTREVVGPPAPALPLLQVGAGIPSIPPKSGEICVCPPSFPGMQGNHGKFSRAKHSAPFIDERGEKGVLLHL